MKINNYFIAISIIIITLISGCGTMFRASEPPISDDLMFSILGNGMLGPNGSLYEISPDDFIFMRQYKLKTTGDFDRIPSRLTLPTRFIIPIGWMGTCYTCHRLDYSVPPENTQLINPVNLPATETPKAESRRLTQITNDPGNDINAQWNPDGTRIAWTSDRSGNWQVWVMDLVIKADSDIENLEQHPVVPNGSIQGWAEWSPDGTRLVYWEYDENTRTSAIRTVHPDGNDVVTIVEFGDALDRPVWSPDGKYIAYASQIGNNWIIWLATSDGQERFQLTDDPKMETNPKWRPDGLGLAYKIARTSDYNLTKEYYLSLKKGIDEVEYFFWDGPQSVQLSDWSPDGTQIVYTAEVETDVTGQPQITYSAVISDSTLGRFFSKGRESLILSQKQTLGDRGPVFSPDGSQIAFWAWDRLYRATLWTVNTDGSNLKQITTAGFDMYPQWSPSGDMLLFESGRSGNMDIWAILVD
jgi:Tol biopolymer transport system component